MNYEPEAPPASVVTLSLAMLGGGACAFVSGTFVFVFAAALRAAYPPWDYGAPAFLEVLAVASAPALAHRGPLRNARARAAARVGWGAALAAFTVFVIAVLAGFVHLHGVGTFVVEPPRWTPENSKTISSPFA